MQVEISRVTPATARWLSHTDPDVFDAPIEPDRLAAFLAAPLHFLAVARSGGLVVGQVRAMVHLQPDGPSQLYIDNLGVALDHQRQGIARALLREAFRWGQETGCEEAWVATELDNQPARALYDSVRNAPEEAVAYFTLDIRALG
jgi:aminoglycoside 6'-N-acetyltransferase I